MATEPVANIDPLRAEAKRLAMLSPEQLREEAILRMLWLGDRSRHAREQLAALDDEMLTALFPGEREDDSAMVE